MFRLENTLYFLNEREARILLNGRQYNTRPHDGRTEISRIVSRIQTANGNVIANNYSRYIRDNMKTLCQLTFNGEPLVRAWWPFSEIKQRGIFPKPKR